MSNHKMKSLLKGLRYISQIFENEKEPEMQIGNPTDVKHVAHIGWDGGSANPPSWMNDFKSPAGLSSAPLPDIGEDSSWVSEGSSRKGTGDLPGLPKSSRRSSTAGSPKEKTDKSKRRSSNPDGSSRSSRRSKESSSQRDESLPKSRRKKSKESVNGGSSRSSRRGRRSENGNDNDSTSEAGSVVSIS